MKSRIQINIHGAVQGVGFRPFIYNLAKTCNLEGYVENTSFGVFIEAEGRKEMLDEFIIGIQNDKPNLARITGMEYSFLDIVGLDDFKIQISNSSGNKSAFILPDIAVCDDCLHEMLNPSDRRYFYPFINCTNCGPRFSIIESLPYDRQNTSMNKFVMCKKCREEYSNLSDRRFHAQPVACPDCGPHVELWNSSGKKLFEKEEAIFRLIELIKDGRIIALKGLGGYQLVVDAGNEDAVQRLRIKKNREEKPFAVMFPFLLVNEFCEVSPLEERLLKSPESPIVILKKKYGFNKNIVCDSVAPGNPYLGVMLPYTPLHHLIMIGLNKPIIATSGNIAEEPMCITEDEALNKLGKIADFFLVHNRPIVRPVDDSIVRIVNEMEMILRRARGYAPFPLQYKCRKRINDKKKKIIAVGAHLKNTIALRVDENIFISQHIGDLSTESANSAFRNAVKDLPGIYGVDSELVIHDLHPGYLSSKFAREQDKPVIAVQHHLAHIASCKLENLIEGKIFGVAWDGTGLGLDGNIWGGEFFIIDDESYSHAGQLRNFLLPGGDQAVKEPRRALAGVLFEIFGEELFTMHEKYIADKFTERELQLIKQMLCRNVNTNLTSSAGRLFDAVSSLIGISHISNYEGQSAMKLEFIVDEEETSEYNFNIIEKKIFICGWQPTIEGIINDLESKASKAKISAKFHNTLARIILKMSEIIGEEKILLSGGCFQNIQLVKKAVGLLTSSGFQVYTHQRIPPNDGGISAGQIAAYDLKYLPFDIEKFKMKNIFQEA